MKKKPINPTFCPDMAMGSFGLEMIQTDPMGSYTGIAEDPYEKPVQDADDL